MSSSLLFALICIAPMPQDPAPAAETAPAATSSSIEPGKRAESLRALSARSAVAEKDLLFSTKPEERALRFVNSEKQRRIEDQKVQREELDFLEEGLRERSSEYRQLRASGRHAEADALIQDGKREFVRDIREVLSLRQDLNRGDQASVQMDSTEDKLQKLVSYKQSERRRYERQRDSEGGYDLGGIHPALIPEVSASAHEDDLTPEVESLFKELFGSSFEISSFRRQVAQGLTWRR